MQQTGQADLITDCHHGGDMAMGQCPAQGKEFFQVLM